MEVSELEYLGEPLDSVDRCAVADNLSREQARAKIATMNPRKLAKLHKKTQRDYPGLEISCTCIVRKSKKS